MIGIINYGSGNLIAIKNILRVIDVECKIVNSKDDLNDVDKYILPGVGDFDECISKFHSLDCYNEIIHEVTVQKKYILGICVGMHMLASKSEEGKLSGLGLINGEVVKFDSTKFKYNAKTPHLGWNRLSSIKQDRLILDVDCEKGFYFLHNYHFICDKNSIISQTLHGYTFPSIVSNENIYGVQFHPEKGQKNGMKLFQNFNNL